MGMLEANQKNMDVKETFNDLWERICGRRYWIRKANNAIAVLLFCFSKPIQAKLDVGLKTKKGSKQSFNPFSFIRTLRVANIELFGWFPTA